MATVCLAGIKIGHVIIGLEAWETLTITGVITVIYSLLGGLKGVILTDFFQFMVAMVGSVWAAYFIIDMPEIGGMDGLLSHQEVKEKLDLIPDRVNNYDLWMGVFLIPLAVQWWSAWYPGAEPGGGGYIAQRMLAAKDEKHATAATLFFNFAHYALRPWPWILIALASIVLFPEIADLEAAFPGLDQTFYQEDLAYPAMLTYLPAGLLGLVLASLISAFMSTISTHLNWGSSYVVNDFYKRFIKPDATEKNLVLVGRISTAFMMLFAALLSLVLEEAKAAFDLIVLVGAGTGLLFILRWFWRAINPYSEIVAMIVSFLVAILFFILGKNDVDMSLPVKLSISVGLTTVAWIAATLLTQNDKYLNPEFEKRAFNDDHKFKNMGYKVLSIFLGSVAIYAALFSIGNYLLGNTQQALYFGIAFVLGAIGIAAFWKKLFE
jgi:Na+/proline symporter